MRYWYACARVPPQPDQPSVCRHLYFPPVPALIQLHRRACRRAQRQVVAIRLYHLHCFMDLRTKSVRAGLAGVCRRAQRSRRCRPRSLPSRHYAAYPGCAAAGYYPAVSRRRGNRAGSGRQQRTERTHQQRRSVHSFFLMRLLIPDNIPLTAEWRAIRQQFRERHQLACRFSARCSPFVGHCAFTVVIH